MSTPLLDDLELLQGLTTIDDEEDAFAHISSPFALGTDLPSTSFNPSTAMQPVGLTPDEAAELLKALDAPDAPHSSANVSTPPQVTAYEFAASKEQKQRRKPGRKKGNGPSPGKMRNPSRERLQNELAYLRGKVVELEGELKAVKIGKRSMLTLTSSRSEELDDGAASRVWRRIAQRQAQGRNEAEAENRRLKGVLEGQLQLAQRLEQVLRKRPNVSVFRDSAADGRKKRLCVGPEDPSSMYELFLSELDGLHAQMDGVFHQTGLETSVDDSLRKAYVRTRKGSEDQDELYAELHDVNIIPFELDQTSSALWYAVRRQYSKNRYHSYEGLKDRPDDTIAVKYRTKCHRHGANCWLDAVMVMRRYVERNRQAIVWRSVSRGEDELSGLYTDETGWSVLKSLPPDSGLRLAGSVMLNCVHVVPKRVDNAVGTPQDEIGLLTNLVIDSYEDDVVVLSTMVEDLLLQDSTPTDSRC